MKPTLLILAAGMGSRYGGLKQLDPVGPNGETIIDYSIFDAVRAGFGRLVFVIRRDIQAAFREIIGIPATVNALIATGRERCRVLETPDSWLGVTCREDRPAVIEGIRRLLARGDYPERLWT